MPYITQEQREEISETLNELIAAVDIVIPSDKPVDGMLNYIVTNLLLSFFNGQGYVGYEKAIGCLECCKLEFYRRAVSSYEEVKRNENGDVYAVDEVPDAV